MLHLRAKRGPGQALVRSDAKRLTGRGFAATATSRARRGRLNFGDFSDFFLTGRHRGCRAMRRERLLFALWTGLIILLVVPWGSLQDHAHWARVGWLPFVSHPVRPGDIIRGLAGDRGNTGDEPRPVSVGDRRDL